MASEYVINNYINPCPDVLHNYIKNNYSWGYKIISIVSNAITNSTIVITTDPLSSTEINELNTLISVWNCSLNFTDPNIGNTPPPQADLDYISSFIGPFLFSYEGSVYNKWLSIDHKLNSDQSTYTIPFKGKISAITFDNRDTNVNIDIEIYRNNQKVYTLKARNLKTMTITNINENIIYNLGDRLNVFLRKRNENKPTNPIVAIYFNIIEGYSRVNITSNSN